MLVKSTCKRPVRSIESEAADQLLRSPTEKCQVHLQRDAMAGI